MKWLMLMANAESNGYYMLINLMIHYTSDTLIGMWYPTINEQSWAAPQTETTLMHFWLANMFPAMRWTAMSEDCQVAS